MAFDKAAVDESDKFGDTRLYKTGDVRDKFTLTTLLLWSVISAVGIGIVFSAIQPQMESDHYRLWDMNMSVPNWQHAVLVTTILSQLILAITGVVAIVVADRRAWAKNPSGSIGRIVFEAIKWILVVCAFLIDAQFLEHVYEAAFI